MLGGLDYRTIAVAVKRALTALGGVLVNPVGADGYFLRGSSAGVGGIAWVGAGMALWNGTLSASQNGTVLTVAVKTTAGNDPSDADPVFVYFRDATSKNGTANVLKINSPTSISTVVGGTFGVANSVAFRLWVVGFNDGGTFRLALINCLSSTPNTGDGHNVTSIFALAQFSVASSTQIGAGSTSAGIFYSAGAAVAAKAYTTLGYLTYEAGLAVAGTFGIDQSRTDLFRVGMPLPGHEIQRARTDTGAVATGTTAIPMDDTIPQSGEGDQFMTQAITPTSAANALAIRAELNISLASSSIACGASMFRDASGNAFAMQMQIETSSDFGKLLILDCLLRALNTGTATFKVRAGGHSGAITATFNGRTSARLYGGVFNSFIEAREIMG